MSHKCPTCGRTFDSKRGLAIHRGQSHEEPWEDADKMRELYIDRDMTTDEIASEFGCSRSTVIRWMEKHGIERDTPMHKIDKSISSGGYRFIKYWKDGMQSGLRVHRVVAYAHGMIDFEDLFDPDVVVHHENDIQLVNSPENLKPMYVGEHVKQHFEEYQEG